MADVAGVEGLEKLPVLPLRRGPFFLLSTVLPEHVHRVTGPVLHRTPVFRVPCPQAVHRPGEPLQMLHFPRVEGPVELFAPLAGGPDRIRRHLLHHPVPVVGHACVPHQEVVDAPFRALFPRQDPPRDFVQPAAGVLPRGFQQLRGKNLPPRPHERIARHQLGSEPGHMSAFVDGVEPEGHFGQLHRHGIQVHAVDVVVGQEHLHLLLLPGVILVGDLFAGLLLFFQEIGLGQLVDGFVQKGRAAHGGLAHGEFEHLVGALVLEQLLQGILHQAAGEDFRGVVGGRLLPVPARKTVDEGSPRVHAELAVLAEHALFLAILREVLGLDEIGGLEGVGVFPGLFHLVEIRFREKPPVGQERFVDGPELVDAELSVGDPSAALPAVSGPGEGHELDDLPEDLVSKLHPVEKRGALRIEKVGLEGRNAERVVGGLGHHPQLTARPFLGRRKPVVDHGKEELQGFVEEGPVSGFLGGERHQFQVPQALQAVAKAVGFGLHGGVTQLRPGLDVEEKEEPVHVAEAFARELPGQVPPVDFFMELFPQIPHGLVAEELDGFPEGVLEIFRDGEGVLVGIFIQGVEEAQPLGGTDAFPVQEGRHGLEGGRFAPGKNFLQVEPEKPLLVPFAAVQQEELAVRGQEDPPGRFSAPEDLPRDHLLQGQRGKIDLHIHTRQTLELGLPLGDLQGIFIVARGTHGFQDPELGGSPRFLNFPHHGEHTAVVQLPHGGFERIAQNGEKVSQELPLELDPLGILAFTFQAVLQNEKVPGQAPQFRMGRTESFFLLPSLPLPKDVLQVVFQDRGKVMVGVKLVFVGDSRKIDGHQRPPFSTATTWM